MVGTKPVAAKKADAKSPLAIYQLKITLKGPRPLIWRRVQVPGLITLDSLDLVIQVAMGWSNSHLHQFIVGTGTKQKSYGMLEDCMDFDDFRMLDEGLYQLRKIAPKEKSKFIYEYDFGDSWRHDVLVEKILPPDPVDRYPIVCLAGKRACPPEDCGGPWGYARMLAVLDDPEDEEHEEMVEWVNGRFDPEFFDLADVNATLNAMAGRR